jgi:hypothetical protein
MPTHRFLLCSPCRSAFDALSVVPITRDWRRAQGQWLPIRNLMKLFSAVLEFSFRRHSTEIPFNDVEIKCGWICISSKWNQNNLRRTNCKEQIITVATRSRHELSSFVWMLGSWVRIPLKAWIWMSVRVYCVFVLSCAWVAALWRADPPYMESYQLVFRLRNWKSGQGPQEEKKNCKERF